MSYTKPSKELVFDLIRSSNPLLPFPIVETSTTLGSPVAITPNAGAIQNTELKVIPRQLSGYIGSAVVRYRRLDLGSIFRSVVPVLPLYSAKPLNQSPFTLYQLLPELNRVFGTSFTTDDLIDGSVASGTDNFYGQGIRTREVLAKAKGTSLGFSGQFTFRWVQADERLVDAIPLYDLDGRVFPGGNDFVSQHKYILDMATYGFDFTEIFPDVNDPAITGAPIGHFTNAVIWERIFAFIQQCGGPTFTTQNPPTPFGLGGITAARYVLPANNQPDANFSRFNRVVVVNYPANQSWAVGQLYLHYNV